MPISKPNSEGRGGAQGHSGDRILCRCLTAGRRGPAANPGFGKRNLADLPIPRLIRVTINEALPPIASPVEQIAEAFDIGIVERRVDFVQHAIGAGLVRNRAKISAIAVSACSPPKTRQGRQALARGRGHDLKARLERIVGFDQLDMRLTAVERVVNRLRK